MNVSFCDCCSLKTGSESLKEIVYDCRWVPESQTPYGTIPVSKHVCMRRLSVLLTVLSVLLTVTMTHGTACF